MNPPRQPSLLRFALRANALFSTTTGLTLLAAAPHLAPILGAPAWVLRGIGLSLLPFAFGLWRNAARPMIRRGEAWWAVALDLGWVAGSAVLVLGELWPLTSAGTWTCVGIAEVVLLFALLQAVGLVRTRALVPAPGR